MKRLFTFLSIISLICIFSLTAAAVETEPQSTEISENSDSAETSKDTEDKNVFALLFEKISEYSGQIFCAMTVVGTAVLSFAYKKGLLPLVKNALGAISGAVGSVKQSAEREAGALREHSAKIMEGLSRTEAVLGAFEDRLDELDLQLSSINQLKRTQTVTEIILKCQVDALGEIFMSSSLPEYRKAALGEKITKMREALKDVNTQSEEG